MRILDANHIVTDLATHFNVVVTRQAAAGTYVNGIYVPAATTTITIPFAVVWPSSPKELQRLPEERRSIESRTFVCTQRLLVATQAGVQSDIVNLDGDGVLWECQSAAEWDAATGYFLNVIQRPAT